MADLYQDTSPAGLALANELNLGGCRRNTALAFGGEVIERPYAHWVNTGIPLGAVNGIHLASLQVDQVQQVIDEASAYFDGAKIPWVWFIGPSTQPPNLSQLLLASGFTLAGHEPAMGVSLDQLAAPPSSPAGLRIERVSDSASLTHFVHAALRGFEMSPAMEPFLGQLVKHQDLSSNALQRLYLGRVGDQPVATTILDVSAGIAGIYSVSTVPHMRGRGIGAAMTAHPLLEVRDEGYRVGILQASEMGYPVYQRMGFTEHFRYEMYTAP